MDAYSPFPIEELNEALGLTKNRLPLIMLLGGIFGGIGGYLLEYWTQVIAWPMNIGGRPFHSWPHFIPVTFECDHARRLARGVRRHARAERAADAVSPGVQRAGVSPRVARPVLPLHRGDGSEVRSPRDASRFSKDLHPVGVSEVEP